MANETTRPLKVFLCHASGDKPAVRDLYKRLIAEGVDAWLDQEKLLPGQNWRVEIPRAVREADVVVICLSNKSITKEGYIQKEIKFALDSADEKPEGTIFLIPARLEECAVPEQLGHWQWVDLFEENGFVRLLRSLKLRADRVGATIEPSGDESEDKETDRRLDQLYTEGLAAFYTEDWDRAYQRFQTILRERPNHKNAAEKLAQAERQRNLVKLYAQATEAYKSENWLAAIKALDELLEKSGDYKDAILLLKDAKKQRQLRELYAEAKRLHAAQKWQAVIRVFDQIAGIDPAYPDSEGLLPSAQTEFTELKRLADLNDLYRQGVHKMDAGEWYEARSLLEQVHKAQTGFLDTERLLRKVENEIIRIEELNKRNNQINTLYEQAHGLIRSRSWRMALDKLEEVQRLDEQFVDKDGIFEKAKTELEHEEQAAQRQNELAAMYAESVRLLKEGKYQEALDKWQEVRSIDPKYPDRQSVQRTAPKKLEEAAKSRPSKTYTPTTKSAWIRLLGFLVIFAFVIVALIVSSNDGNEYDSFDNPTFDGKFNASLWSPVVKSPSYIKQDRGLLTLSIEPNSEEVVSLYAIRKIKANQYNFAETRVLLSRNRAGEDGDISFSLIMKDKKNQDIIFWCGISRFPPIKTWCEVYGRNEEAEYLSVKKTTNYEIWHTFRIEIDPEINAVFYIDGLRIGSYRPKDAEELRDKDFTVRLEVWSPLRTGIEAHIDTVWIGQYK